MFKAQSEQNVNFIYGIKKKKKDQVAELQLYCMPQE